MAALYGVSRYIFSTKIKHKNMPDSSTIDFAAFWLNLINMLRFDFGSELLTTSLLSILGFYNFLYTFQIA